MEVLPGPWRLATPTQGLQLNFFSAQNFDGPALDLSSSSSSTFLNAPPQSVHPLPQCSGLAPQEVEMAMMRYTGMEENPMLIADPGEAWRQCMNSPEMQAFMREAGPELQALVEVPSPDAGNFQMLPQCDGESTLLHWVPGLGQIQHDAAARNVQELDPDELAIRRLHAHLDRIAAGEVEVPRDPLRIMPSSEETTCRLYTHQEYAAIGERTPEENFGWESGSTHGRIRLLPLPHI